jgi:putative membrane-bound dehydrogenase-like protein
MNQRAALALVVACLVSCLFTPPAVAHDVGVAAVDVTPDYNVRLNGFAHRKGESEGVDGKIYAKALAFRDETHGPAVLLAVDSLGVPDYMTRDVAARLQKKANLDPARFAITSTHTHSAPILKDACPNIAGEPIPPEQMAKIDRYTKELADNLEEVALAAIKDLKPATIEYGVGTHALAMNRRTPGGPVDHDLPVMVVRDPATKKIRAVYLSYACHCVTLSHMKISGDWAGFAAAAIENKFPGAVALTSIGCGADANPTERDKLEIAIEQGNRLAAAVDRVLKQPLAPLDQPLATQLNRISLNFDKHPTRAQLEEIAKRNPPYQGYYAKVQLEKLDRGEKLQTELSYPIQTWTFGDQLAMVFLPGEVVVDYSLRLKKEFDRGRMWINAYSNDVPCYIASERVLKEGGYEVDSSMWFYDRPSRLAVGVEKKIVDEVHRQLPKSFLAPAGTEGVAPKTPLQSLRSMRTRDDLEIELVAAEPQVASPIAIDWSADGRMFVCEMFDYPTGVDGSWRPGGRVRVLEDADRDGAYEKSTIFLDNIPFPTGVTAYARGVIVCAAPDILFAQDTDHDGNADKVEKLFSGFATDNYQARVNSITLGLDNWLHAGNGLLGGLITNDADVKVDIRNRDFRFRFPKGPLETVEGLTQFGRVRDDFGAWFGCDNSNPIQRYPHEERYLRRNPHAPAPPSVVRPKTDHDLGRVYPISRTLERFNDPGNVNRVTSGCGLALYRDELMPQLAGNAFYCEPVHNLVSRMILPTGDADGFRVSRAPEEQAGEFLASSDNWFRPTQVRTGPDGALYVVDMYRFLIEHPRWIPAERLAQLDVRAGADRGRIFRVRPRGGALREIRDLTKLSAAPLVAALDTPNGTERDRVHLELITREGASDVRAPLETLAQDAKSAAVRVQALAALDGLDVVVSDTLIRAIKDPDDRVRAFAVRLYEGAEEADRVELLALVADPSLKVRRQLAYTLGEWDDARAAAALAKLATQDIADAEMRIAVLSSAARPGHCGAVLDAVAASTSPARDAWLPPLVATAAASDDADLLKRALAAVTPDDSSKPSAARFVALASLLDALDGKGAGIPEAAAHLAAARRVAADAAADAATRQAAVRVLGRGGAKASEDELALLCGIVGDATSSDALRDAALAALRRQHSPAVAERLLVLYPTAGPRQRALLVSLLLERDEWATLLLDALEQRKVAPTEISLTDRQRLFESPSQSIRARAQSILPPLSAGKRDEIVARYATAKDLPGVASRGADLFARNCAACHAFDGTGHDVGPDLAALRDKDADYLVKNILDPNAIIEPRFVNYQLQTSDKRWLSGVMKAESATSLTLAAGNGVTETVARGDVKAIKASTTSMMPEGFEGAFTTPQEMADLIAYLKQSAAAAAARRQFAGNTPATIKPDKSGTLMLPATRAEIFGSSIMLESEFQNIGYWHGQGDHVAWTVEVPRGGEFDVFFDYACEGASAGNTFAVDAGGGRAITGVVAGTGPDWTRYVQKKVGTLRLAAGRNRVVVRPDAAVRGALIDLRHVALAPPGTQPKWPVAKRQAAAAASSDGLARTPAAVAAVILDPSKSNAAREAAINANPQFAAELIVELTRDLAPDDAKTEYQRIPWIWRVAIAAGKRNDAPTLKKMLDASLPRKDEPLRDWQAVVVGGGIINGISQQGAWPGDRIAEIIGDDANLQSRWQRVVDLSSAMADNEKTPPGTRYDALRMLGVESWEKRGEQLEKYLKHDNAELQMGAVSGLSDVKSPEAAKALEAALPALTENNRKLAEDGLKRERPK